MEPIEISNSPVTGLKRKVEYDFYWLTAEKKITVNCRVLFFNSDGSPVTSNEVNNNRPVSLTASDTLVKAPTGAFLTTQEKATYDAYLNNVTAYNRMMNTYNNSYLAYQEALALYEEENPKVSAEPTAPIEPTAPTAPFQVMTEYEFYIYVLGAQPIVLPDVIKGIILQRDSQGRFN